MGSVAEHVVSQSILAYMTDVSTLYYNDPTDVGPDGYVESGGTSGGILGKAMGISYEYSNALFQGMCHATAGSTYFAHLYAAIEKFRASSDLFHFVNFDGIARSDRFRLELSEEEVYPEHVEDRINFGSRIVTIASAFTEEVAAAATVLLQTKLGQRQASALPARRFRFGSLVNPTDGCTRILLEQPNITLTGLEFRQGGICTKMASENLRIPIIAGGPRVVNLRIRDTVCVDCVAGLVGVRGGDPALGAGAVAANVDVENMTVFNSVFLWTSQNSVDGGPSRPAFCSGTERMSTCQKATLPGIESSFARIVGSPVVASCPSQHSTAEHIINEFCDLVMPYGSVALMHAQHPGSPIASFNSFTSNQDTDCSSSCFPDMYADYNTLYGNVSPSLKPCCDGLNPPEIYTCPAGNTEYTRTEPTAGQCSAGFANCFWNRMRDDRFRPEWIDTVVDQTTLAQFASNAKIDDALCATFYAMCFPLCTSTQTKGCNVCLGNQTFIDGERCKTPEELAALVTVPQLAEGETVSRGDALDLLRQIGSRPRAPPRGFRSFQTAIFWSAPTTRPTTRPTTQPTCQKRRRARTRQRSCPIFASRGCPARCARRSGAPTSRTTRHRRSSRQKFRRARAPLTPPRLSARRGTSRATARLASAVWRANQHCLARRPDNQLSIAASSRRRSDPEWRNGVCAVRRLQQRRNTGRFHGPDQICRRGRYRERHVSHPQRHPDAHGHRAWRPPLGHAVRAPERGAGFHVCAAPRTWRLAAADSPGSVHVPHTENRPDSARVPRPAGVVFRVERQKLCGQKYPHSISSSTPAPVVMPCFPCAVGIDVGGTAWGPSCRLCSTCPQL